MAIYTTDEMSVEEFTAMVRQHPVEFEPLPARFWEDERWLFEHVAELARLFYIQKSGWPSTGNKWRPWDGAAGKRGRLLWRNWEMWGPW